MPDCYIMLTTRCGQRNNVVALNGDINVAYRWCRFEALLEREWLQAGHPFGDRCEKSAFANSKLRQESPVFLLFLDCAWQVWRDLAEPPQQRLWPHYSII